MDPNPDPLDPYYRRLAGSVFVWRDTDLDPGHINVQNNDIVCVGTNVFAEFKLFCSKKYTNKMLKQISIING